MTSSNEDIVIALYDYQAKDPEELTIRKNEQLMLIDGSGPWYKVRNKLMNIGLVPSNYVKSKVQESLVNRIGFRFPGSKKKVTAGEHLGGGSNFSSSLSNPDGDIHNRRTPGNTMEKYIAKYNYTSTQPDELDLVKGITINVLKKEDDGWWQGKDPDGREGWFPSNYVELMTESMNNDMINNSHPTPNDAKPVLEVARALYSFNSGNPEELSFEAGDMFDILGKPASDPEWYEARNADGKMGLIPRNYIETVPGAISAFLPERSNYDDVTPEMFQGNHKPADQNISHGAIDSMMGKPWYFGSVKRTEAERMLMHGAQNSEFMVRDSESTVGDLSVSMKAPDRIKHFKVSRRDGKFCIGQRKFDSVEHLIEHYKKSPIYTSPEVGKIYLSHPMPH